MDARIRRSYLFLAGSILVVGFAAFFTEPALGRHVALANLPAANTPKTIDAGVTHPKELTLEKAKCVRHAIMQGNYPLAYDIAANVYANSKMQNWRYYPFSDFIQGIADVTDPAFEGQLNAWISKSGGKAIPILVRAQFYFDMGWFRRGGYYTADTPRNDQIAFAEYMKKALADADAAIRLDDKNPYGFYLKLRILRGSSSQQAMKSAFAEAIAKYPAYYPLYDLMLSKLEPKWGGTVASMHAFVEQYAGQADEYSPLKLLYLSLYRDLLNAASTACGSYASDKDKMAQCVTSLMQKTVTSELEKKVADALRLYDHVDRYQFGIAVEGILLDMLKTRGGDFYAGAVLQQAAGSTHSDTQLKEDKPGHNNYVIDKLVSESWYLKGFYNNALSKSQEALKDVATTSFASEEDKALATAGVYEFIAGVHNKLNQYADMIAAEKSAVALGGITGSEHFICFGLYKLKAYDDAVQACTKTIDDQPSKLQARYWRGLAYRDSGKLDAALKDLRVVANSTDDFRTHAAIDMSMIYFGRNDVASALELYNQYQYLYNPHTNNKTDIAVSYNNRCYAYMQFGEYKKALDDCTASLKYGSIPDAFRKQQELTKLLKEKGL